MVPARTKSILLLVIGGAVVLFLAIPLRLGRAGISGLSIKTRARLVEQYERPARGLAQQADSIRQGLLSWQGYVTPIQDSCLGKLKSRAQQLQQIVEHLRHPEQATVEENRQDIPRLLARLCQEAQRLRDSCAQLRH